VGIFITAYSSWGLWDLKYPWNHVGKSLPDGAFVYAMQPPWYHPANYNRDQYYSSVIDMDHIDEMIQQGILHQDTMEWIWLLSLLSGLAITSLFIYVIRKVINCNRT